MGLEDLNTEEIIEEPNIGFREITDVAELPQVSSIANLPEVNNFIFSGTPEGTPIGGNCIQCGQYVIYAYLDPKTAKLKHITPKGKCPSTKNGKHVVAGL